jgi:hypothetical protein
VSAPVSFVTVSGDKKKTAAAIAAHLRPVFQHFVQEFREENASLSRVTMVSDSPSNQYRSKKMMYIFQRLMLRFDVYDRDWIFTEADGFRMGVSGRLGSAIYFTTSTTCALQYWACLVAPLH